MSVLSLYWLFQRAVMLSFSGFATVPLLRDALVLNQGLLTDAQLNDAIAISQSSPGPLGLYVVVVGYFVAGIPGAAAGVLALAAPAFLAIPIARLVLRGKSGVLKGVCSGIVIASCALMLAAGLRLAQQAATAVTLGAIVVVGALVLALTNVKPVWVIASAAVLGLVVSR
jgi:chromate transporter